MRRSALIATVLVLGIALSLSGPAGPADAAAARFRDPDL